MAGRGRDEEPIECASPPCALGDLDPAFAGLSGPAELAAWRKSERTRILERRTALNAAERESMTARMAERIEDLLGDPHGLVVSAWWPFRGEPDLKPLLRRLGERGAVTALPVVVEKAQPMEFRAWKSGDRLAHGVWKIPIPADGAVVIPDVVLSPVVGFDPQCYRLGYGGGYFDRTLATFAELPRRIGVGYAFQAMPTIRPQPYDIPMEMVVTEEAVVTPER